MRRDARVTEVRAPGRNDLASPSIRRLLFGLAIMPCLFTGVAIEVSASEEAPYRPSVDIGWTSRPPEIDGHLGSDEWSDAAHIDGLTQEPPDEGQAATQRTEIWLMTDGDNLYGRDPHRR